MPQSAILKKYVELFYAFAPGKPRQLSYAAFPHVNTCVSFFRGASITRKDFGLFIEQDKTHPLKTSVEILGKYTRPVLVRYNGDFEEISIVFKPLGVNHFLQQSLINYAPHYSQPLPSDNWLGFSSDLFETSGDRISLLEKFLLLNLKETNVLEQIKQSLICLENGDSDYSIEAVAAMAGMNLKTFQRNFMKHLACSPAAYKRIARFRAALNSKLQSDKFRTLTSITYENNYYDQSYFIREFRKLTNLNPTQFFREITRLHENRIVWELK